MTQPSKSAMREAILLIIEEWAESYEQSQFDAQAEKLINLFTNTLNELESKVPEKWIDEGSAHDPTDLRQSTDYFRALGHDKTIDQVHAAFAAFREENGL